MGLHELQHSFTDCPSPISFVDQIVSIFVQQNEPYPEPPQWVLGDAAEPNELFPTGEYVALLLLFNDTIAFISSYLLCESESEYRSN